MRQEPAWSYAAGVPVSTAPNVEGAGKGCDEENTEEAAPCGVRCGAGTQDDDTIIDDADVVRDNDVDAVICGACTFCGDVCGDDNCESCAAKHTVGKFDCDCAPEAHCRRRGWPLWSECQVARQVQAGRALIVSYGWVYDATEFAPKHPGSAEAILRKVGMDCSVDYDFHRRPAQRQWADLRVARLFRCPRNGPEPTACVVC